MEEITMTIERNIYITECYQPLRDDKYYYTLMYPAVFAAGSFLLGQLICWCSVSVDLIVSNRIAVLAAAIAGVALDGVDTAILHFLHDANMIGRTVLAAIIPIEKDNVARARLIAVVLPQSALLEPRHPLRCTGRKLRNDASFNIAALVSTPAHKAGAPLYSAVKTIPTPVRLTADIPHLGECHGDDLTIASADAVEDL